ncbi:hypothetical protein E6C50_11030 [Flavobacterium supellecticarium]|uniref:Uncharacterized protein n=1 Tax=Flavobacterium supellecticarium TaxID=2565924 RepID=A0A4S3ZW68_9FLAO|nr:hypothetical protein [Flavobacterium supellecticarium]THF49879.1 hypothetical protein E6C50_11030 [Flavobacterium supellecticarium]
MKALAKKISLLSFVLLMLPFFQTCSDKNIIHNRLLKGGPALETVPLLSEQGININENKEHHLSSDELFLLKEQAIEAFLKKKSELTYNGYEMSFFSTNTVTSRFRLEYSFFTMVILLCGMQAFSLFKERYSLSVIFGLINIVLSVGLFLLLYFSGILEDINQIKYGYYLFMIHLVLLLYMSFELKKKKIESIKHKKAG